MDGWYIGNILFGGVIGFLIVDPATGAMWKLGDPVYGNLAPDPNYKEATQLVGAQVEQAGSFQTTGTSPSISDQLKELKQLKATDILTDDEYEAKRAALVKRL
jgi:hypothetical protein